MQTPALFKPMNLGEGFDDFDFGFSNDSVFYQPDVFDSPIDIPVNIPVDYGLDMSLPQNIATVDNSGNVDDQFGKRVISADAITNIALGNPGREGEAIAQTLKNIAPNWTSQFKDADSLVKAAYNLFNTSKAVIQGKPIPQSVQSPYVYNPANPNVYRPTTATSQLSMSSTNMLLIGGVALAAFLVLRKK